MILDNSAIDYSRMLLLVFYFLVYKKIEPNYRQRLLAPPATPGLRLDYNADKSKLSKKKCDVKDNNF